MGFRHRDPQKNPENSPEHRVPGRSGWFPTQTPHRSVLARLTHTAPHVVAALSLNTIHPLCGDTLGGSMPSAWFRGSLGSNFVFCFSAVSINKKQSLTPKSLMSPKSPQSLQSLTPKSPKSPPKSPATSPGGGRRGLPRHLVSKTAIVKHPYIIHAVNVQMLMYLKK